MRRETKTWVGRIVAAASVTFALGYIPYHVYARSGLARTLMLRRYLQTLRLHNADLPAEHDRLAREVDALRSDVGAIERAERAARGWVRRNQIAVSLPPPVGDRK